MPPPFFDPVFGLLPCVQACPSAVLCGSGVTIIAKPMSEQEFCGGKGVINDGESELICTTRFQAGPAGVCWIEVRVGTGGGMLRAGDGSRSSPPSLFIPPPVPLPFPFPLTRRATCPASPPLPLPPTTPCPAPTLILVFPPRFTPALHPSQANYYYP